MILHFLLLASSLRLRKRDLHCATGVTHPHHPWRAAHRAVFDIRLIRSSAWVYANLDFLATIWADGEGVDIGDPIAHWKIFVERKIVLVLDAWHGRLGRN